MNSKVYFDLDGTIIDVLRRYYTVLILYAKQNGIDANQINFENYKELKRQQYKDHVIVRKLTGCEFNIKKYVNFKRKTLETASMLQMDSIIGDPKSNIMILRELGFDIELLSLRRKKTNAFLQLKSLGLYHCFDKITFLHPRSNNAKKIYLEKKIKDTDIIIGDGPLEMECGKIFGVKTFFVNSGLYDYRLMKPGQYIVCDDYEEAVRIIAERGDQSI